MQQIDIRASASVFALALFGILFIIMGFQGSLGRMLAVILCPDKLEVWEGGEGNIDGGASFGEEKTA